MFVAASWVYDGSPMLKPNVSSRKAQIYLTTVKHDTTDIQFVGICNALGFYRIVCITAVAC